MSHPVLVGNVAILQVRVPNTPKGQSPSYKKSTYRRLEAGARTDAIPVATQ